MNCTSIDLKAYFLGELDSRERTLTESHAGAGHAPARRDSATNRVRLG
jgi:hypothetical protein